MGPDWLATRVVELIPLILSLSVHEWAHAYAASRLGDDTARHLGRMTLNPLSHIDPIGTLLLPLLGVPFGWARPVPINPLRFVGVPPAAGMMLAAAAGPIANGLLALAGTGLLAVAVGAAPSEFAAGTGLGGLLERFILLNLLLGFFNLLPVPPLDGSRIADWLMPASLQRVWGAVHDVSGFLLVAVIGVPLWFGIDLLAGPRALAAALVALAR